MHPGLTSPRRVHTRSEHFLSALKWLSYKLMIETDAWSNAFVKMRFPKLYVYISRILGTF